jgi:Mrp family chromosome partitioning ATPase
MAVIVGIVSQKNGVGKSTMARLLALEYAEAGWNAKIADLYIAQGTSFSWQARRLPKRADMSVRLASARLPRPCPKGWPIARRSTKGAALPKPHSLH